MAGDSKGPATSVLEWIAAGVGLVAALALLGIIANDAITGRDDPVPVLSVEAQRVVPTPTGYVLEFRVVNSSDQTAAAVQVEGSLKGGAEEIVSTATIDYVPGESQATGGLVFPADPRRGSLELRATGYEIP